MAVFRGVLFLLWLKRSLVLCGLIQTEIQTKSFMSWRNWDCTSFPASSKSGDNWLYRLGSTLKASYNAGMMGERTRPGTIRTWLPKCSRLNLGRWFGWPWERTGPFEYEFNFYKFNFKRHTTLGEHAGWAVRQSVCPGHCVGRDFSFALFSRL